jgi:hypothetical protein
MKTRTDSEARDISYVTVGVILLFLSLLPSGPFGFLPLNISLYFAISLFILWASKYSLSLKEIIIRYRKIFEISLLILLFFLWFLIKVFAIHPSTTDENIYFYMAKRFSEGLIPYRDFFFAHPPMHIIIPAIIFKIAGFNIVIAKLIPVGATLIAGIFLYKMLKFVFGEIAGFAGLILYLFSYQVLMASSDMTGINITAMFVSISVYYFIANRMIAAGVFTSFAISSGLYSSPVVVLFLIWLLIKRDFKGILRYLLAFLIPFILIFGTFYLSGRENFILGVFKYHILKPEKIPDRVDIFSTMNPFIIIYGLFKNSIIFISSREFLKSIYFHSPLYILFTLTFIYFIIGSIRDIVNRKNIKSLPFYSTHRMLGFAILGFILFVLEYSSLKEIYDFYLVFLYFFMAIGAAYSLKYIYELPYNKGFWQSVFITSLIVVCLWTYKPLSQSMDRPLFGGDIKKDGERISYTYKEPHFITVLSDLAKMLYFKDYRIAGKMEPFYRHYIWNKNLSFEKAFEIADYVRNNSNVNETISGASTIAPLIALLSNRRVAAEEVDTNAKRFKSGILSEEAFFRKICSDNLRFFVISAKSYFSERYVGHSDFFRNSFIQENKFTDPGAQHFIPLDVYLFKPLYLGCGLER